MDRFNKRTKMLVEMTLQKTPKNEDHTYTRIAGDMNIFEKNLCGELDNETGIYSKDKNGETNVDNIIDHAPTYPETMNVMADDESKLVEIEYIMTDENDIIVENELTLEPSSNVEKEIECIMTEENDIIIENQPILDKSSNIEKEIEYTMTDENDIIVDNEPSLNNSLNVEKEDNLSALKKKQNTRKRRVMPQSWKRNVRKESHQSGQSYVSSRGKKVPGKQIKNRKNCLNSCIYNCSKHISEEERNALFQSYYSLSQNEKYMFIAATTERKLVARKYVNSTKRNYTFSYFFNVKGEKIRVCKIFYLDTISISQKPIYNVHLNMNLTTNTPKPDNRGKNKFSTVSEEQKDLVRKHINSFNRVQSHYCRSKTSKEYLESNLNMNKMFELYEEESKSNGKQAVKLSMYRFIFNNEFNISFHMPKGDRCDTCELLEKSSIESPEYEKYKEHVLQKNLMREEKNRDKTGNIPMVMFDLQNVITCPRAGVGSFYYRRKLNLYNLTAYFSTTKTKYCVLWTETSSGRTGNDLASAFRMVLDKIAEENDFTELITWSDSCVPQNRNSIISYAVLDFLKKNPHIEKITMKYSTPGHSGIQEVDNVHSQIEQIMKGNEFYSPVSFIRLLKGANKKKPFRIVQMQANDFKDFSACAKIFNYKIIPYSKVCCLKFTQSLFEVGYRTSFSHEEFTNVSLKNNIQRGKRIAQNQISMEPKVLTRKLTFCEEKKKDINEMLQFMPIVDQEYYKAILK